MLGIICVWSAAFTITHPIKDNTMKLLRVISLLIPLAICICPSQAVVHGIQSHSTSSNFDSSGGNSNGYRYNGPAHKYLPPTTAAHWEPSNSFGPTQPGHYQQAHNYDGPYSMQYYEREPLQQTVNAWQQEPNAIGQQQHHQYQQQQQEPSGQYNNNNNYQYAGNHKPAATPTTISQFGTAFGVSSGAHYNIYRESDLMDTQQLTTQALPERQQQQLFAADHDHHRQPNNYEQQLGGGSNNNNNFVQMQSHSYELPSSSSYGTHGQWQPVEKHHHQQVHQPQLESVTIQKQRPSMIFKPEQSSYNHDESSYQGHAYGYNNGLIAPQQQQQHYVQSNIFQSSQLPNQFPSSSYASSHVSEPSREFLAPYF